MYKSETRVSAGKTMSKVASASPKANIEVIGTLENNKITVVRQSIVDAFSCQTDLFSSEESNDVLQNAARSVGATVVKQSCTDYTPYGFTNITLLAESHIILTTWPEYDYATFNIFLCNENMSVSVVRDCLLDYLRPKSWRQGFYRHPIGYVANNAKAVRVFLGAPFSAHICENTQEIDRKMRSSIERIAFAIREIGASVFVAHEREDWGKRLLSPDLCTELDFCELQNADVLVALADEPSYGVCVELGWASACHIPIVLFSWHGDFQTSTPLVEGLNRITQVSKAIGLLELTEIIRCVSPDRHYTTPYL